MDDFRRCFLKLAGSAGAVAAAAGLLRSAPAWAAPRNRAAFEAKSAGDVLRLLGVSRPIESKEIVIAAPDVAENGAVVPISVTSRIPDTEQIAIIAEKNPFPLAASFDVMPGGEGYVSVRIKMAQTSDVRAVVKAGGRSYTAAREVKVTIGGCG